MSRRRHTPEQIITALRKAEVELDLQTGIVNGLAYTLPKNRLLQRREATTCNA